jgi:hypothetical protein
MPFLGVSLSDINRPDTVPYLPGQPGFPGVPERGRGRQATRPQAPSGVDHGLWSATCQRVARRLRPAFRWAT